MITIKSLSYSCRSCRAVVLSYAVVCWRSCRRCDHVSELSCAVVAVVPLWDLSDLSELSELLVAEVLFGLLGAVWFIN